MTKKLSDKQKVFNKVVRHLGKQRSKSKDYKKHLCLYRGPNGKMCAVGCLIKDEFYSTCLEGNIIDTNSVEVALSYSGVSDEILDSNFLVLIQNIHDYNHPNSWPRKLRSFAKEEGLDSKVVDKAFTKRTNKLPPSKLIKLLAENA